MASLGEYDLGKVSADLKRIMNESTKRGLKHTVKWAAELFRVLADHITLDSVEDAKCMTIQDFADYSLAKSLFDGQEYDRAAHILKNSKTPIGKFLYYYSKYCSVAKKYFGDSGEASSSGEQLKISPLSSLRLQLQKDHLQKSLDGYCLYVYGVVLRKLKLDKEALKIFCESVQREPLIWSSWFELASLISDREMLNELTLPDSWIKDFFLAHTYIKIEMNESALEIYTKLMKAGFSESPYVQSQILTAKYNMGQLETALVGFQEIQKVDPYRLDNFDIYSNILYAKNMRVELGNLAEKTFNIDRHREETCYVIGNFYNLRLEPERAVLYFQRAVRLNPSYVSPWTLIGNQYIEMRNYRYAIQAYHQAIKLNRRDYRAWYGLGQTYQNLLMSPYSIHYFKQAHDLRPSDSRIMLALGEAYESLGKFREAQNWFWKACRNNDIEGMASIKLAEIYRKMNEGRQASDYYISI